jgi:hypothetical protein
VDGDGAAIGQELACVVEDHHAIAQQPPPLLGVERHKASRVMVDGVRRWALGLVLTHDWHLNPIDLSLGRVLYQHVEHLPTGAYLVTG